MPSAPDSKQELRGLFAQAPAPWNCEHDELECCYVRQDTADVKSFVFKCPQSRFFSFLPGQFITLELEIGGERINRTYTISSSAARPFLINITVKRVDQGKVSNWLHDNLRVGSKIKAMGPGGSFSCLNHPAEKYLMLSGGSGVTPMLSMMRTFHDLSYNHDIAFVHSARSPADIICHQEFDLMERNLPGFHAFYICAERGEQKSWKGPIGLLDQHMLKMLVPDYLEREIFTCGPAPYMQAIRSLLEEDGFDLAHYHEESFTFSTPAEAMDAYKPAITIVSTSASPSASKFTVEFSKRGGSISCDAQSTILDAARQAGIRLPASCSQGICGTCKVKMASGEVLMAHNGGIRQREIDNGYILACCSKPITDVVLEI